MFRRGSLAARFHSTRGDAGGSSSISQWMAKRSFPIWNDDRRGRGFFWRCRKRQHLKKNSTYENEADRVLKLSYYRLSLSPCSSQRLSALQVNGVVSCFRFGTPPGFSIP
jgi:hypothetical protein